MVIEEENDFDSESLTTSNEGGERSENRANSSAQKCSVMGGQS